MSISRQVIDHVLNTDFQDIDSIAVIRAKDRVLDSLGNILIGRDAPGNDAAMRVYATDHGRDEATILGRGIRAGAAAAATINSLMQRSWDFEACGAEDKQRRLHPAHISGSTFPTALAVGERSQASGEDMLRALILGDDITARITVASGFNLAIGTDNTGISNGFGCVVTAGLLAGLTGDQLLHAFGLVLNQLSGTIENIFDGAMAFKLPQALSARNAIESVDLAAGGFTGPNDPLGGRFGFFSLFGGEADSTILTQELGTRFYGDMVIKPWSCCRIVQGPVEAATILRQQINVDDIQEIRVIAPQAVLDGFTAVPFIHGESTEVAAIFNLAMCVALGLEFGEVRPELINSDVLSSPRVKSLHHKIRLEPTPSAESGRPAGPTPIRVELEMTDGQTVSEAVPMALGEIYKHPLSRDQLLDKYYRNMEHGGVSPDNADEVRHLVENLESLSDIRIIGSLLQGPFGVPNMTANQLTANSPRH